MVKKFVWYPAEDEKKHYKKSPKAKTAKLRKGITPGSVLVLLAGRFRGRRVVFLKQLSSGLLLVTGPYKVNGVPLKRVNQAYTLTTSTKVDLKGVDASKIDDALFKKEKKAKKAGEEKFFNEAAKVFNNHFLTFLFYRRRRSPRQDLTPRRPSTVAF
jgi:large subunit ribosomal protein L6e